MLPAPFEYAAPTTLEEALGILAERGDEAKPLAGGQSLIPLMKLRFATPALVVDLNRVPDLGFIERADDHLRVGALARHSDLATSEAVASAFPAMATAAPLVSDPIVRNLGTIGGSLAHADPAGDWGSVMLALDAEIVAKSAGGERTIPIAEFIQGTFTTALEPTELITEVRVPTPGGAAGGTYLKLERKVGDFATVGAAVQVDQGRDRRGGPGGRGAQPRVLRGGGRTGRGGNRARVRRPGLRRVQAPRGSSVRAAGARAGARDRPGLGGGWPWRSPSR